MRIHIFFRHAPIRRLKAQNRPNWFAYSAAFLNLIATIEDGLKDGRVAFHFLFDGSDDDKLQDELYLLFRQRLLDPAYPEHAVSERSIQGGDQRKAWRACMKEADCTEYSSPDDLLYFLENDYVHVPEWLAKIEELAQSSISWDYLTLYDHLDKYPLLCSHKDSKRYAGLKSKIYCSGSHHWRTSPGTCASYITRASTFRLDRRILGLGLYDFRLFKILRHLRRRQLLSPIPSLSTHSMSAFLAPVVNWESIVD